MSKYLSRKSFLVSLVAIAFALNVGGTIRGQNVTAQRAKMEIQIPIDFSLLTTHLESRNEAPSIRGGIAKFSPDFDFNEQIRVSKVIRVLILYADVALPELILACDRDEYSYTLGFGYGATNFSVGAICRLVIQNNLEKPYRSQLTTGSKGDNLPSFEQQLGLALYNKEDFCKWLNENKGLTLTEMQIANLARVESYISDNDLTEEVKRKLVSVVVAIRKELESKPTNETVGSLLPGREQWLYHCREDAIRYGTDEGRK